MNKMLQFLKKDNTVRKRQIYAVHGGIFLGYGLTIIDFNKESKIYSVLACKLDELVPKALDIPEADMILGVQEGLLTLVDRASCKVFRECQKEYYFRKNTK